MQAVNVYDTVVNVYDTVVDGSSLGVECCHITLCLSHNTLFDVRQHRVIKCHQVVVGLDVGCCRCLQPAWR